jgi:cell wall-associated NlpC family hydrolase
VSHPVRIRTFTLAAALLAAALLACLPTAARATSGGAAPGAVAAPAATAKNSGGAAPGAVARRRRAVRRRARRAPVPVPVSVTGASTATPSAPATLLADGTASLPPGAPAEVAAVVAAANRIASLPYRWGGGHARWEDTGYDCSGSVGYALHGGALLAASATSGGLMTYGEPGPGTWITVYANADHVYMVVAGLRFDTSGARPSRWQATARSTDGYAVRHPSGL